MSTHSVESQTPGRGIALLTKADSALSTDFCPWANRYIEWLKNPFWVLVLAIVGSVACGIFLNPLVFGVTGLLVVVTIIGVLLPWVAVRGIDCDVSFDVPRARVNSTTIVRLKIRNRWPISVWGLSLIRGFAREVSADGNEGVSLARVPGWSVVEYSWAFEPQHRGVYPRGMAEVETGFPFGLFRAQRIVQVNGQLTVWPATVRLEGMPDAAEAQHTEEQLSPRRAGEFGDTMGTRLFRSGDSLRRVHWAQTARQQTLIVTERQAPAMTSVRIVLDLSVASHPLPDQESTVELAVQTAASLCESLHRQHSRVELVVGATVLVAGDAAAGFTRVMDALAVADISEVETKTGRRSNMEIGEDRNRRKGPRTAGTTDHAAGRELTSGKSLSGSGGAFEILITTTAGRRHHHPRQIVIGDQTPNAWIQFEGMEELLSDLPTLWKKACHAS